MIPEHDLIALTENLPEQRLVAGDIGVVVGVYKQGEAYEVEFMTRGGRTVAVLTLLAAQVRPVAQDEMTQARPLQAAA